MRKPAILIIGHSHITALIRARDSATGYPNGVDIEFVNLRDERYARTGNGDDARMRPAGPDAIKRDLLLSDYCKLTKTADWVVFCMNGNEHNNFGMFETAIRTFDNVISRIHEAISRVYPAWLRLLMPCTRVPIFLLPPPPPIEAEDFIMRTGKLARIVRSASIRRASDRLAFYQKQIEATRSVAEGFGVEVLSLPDSVISSTGFMAEDCRRESDPSHGNGVYGDRVLRHVAAYLRSGEHGNAVGQRSAIKKSHLYSGLPDHAFWRQSVTEPAFGDVDPVVDPPFKVTLKDNVATAGSCFAQHISKRLRDRGFRFLLAEEKEGLGENSVERGFYDFSARYGNIYTSRQLLQLFDRAFGYFKPLERVWERSGGGYCDPFRPRIEPDGFATESAVIEDMRKHLAAVKRMFRKLDVFVFTLGLTECWMSKLDGAVYPLAPGVAGGEFDPDKHAFVNLGVADVVMDLNGFIGKLRLVNPQARLILTVSPVPLVATYEERHVLVSTAYSKAVLRVAAEEVARGTGGVYYFPSYEIIAGNHAAGRYFDSDRRSVTSEGVDHVMRVFLARLTDASPKNRVADSSGTAADAALEAEIDALGEALCDEEMLVG